jgi:hypothetical protein
MQGAAARGGEGGMTAVACWKEDEAVFSYISCSVRIRSSDASGAHYLISFQDNLEALLENDANYFSWTCCGGKKRGIMEFKCKCSLLQVVPLAQ